VYTNSAGDILTATAAEDGTLFFSQYPDNWLVSFNPYLQLTNWVFNPTNAGDMGESAPALSIDGNTVYITDSRNHIYAVNSTNGAQLWSFFWPSDFQPFANQYVAVGFDGTVFAIGTDQHAFILALNPTNGAVIWQITNGPLVNLDVAGDWGPVIGGDGTLYVPSQGLYDSFVGRPCHLWALNPTNGATKWIWTNNVSPHPAGQPSAFTSSLSVGPDGTVYGVVDADVSDPPTGILVAISNGKTKWNFSLQSDVARDPSTPAIAADGTLYIGSLDWNLYALNSANGSILWTNMAPFGELGNSSPIIGPDGVVYICDNGGDLYAFCGSAPPACSSWPMYQRNARHTSRLDSSNMSSPRMDAQGIFHATVTATNRNICDICASVDLVNWKPVGTASTANNGTGTFTDTNSVHHSYRFYRSIAQ
jgi:outer membrane protein assembly factor BamB